LEEERMSHEETISDLHITVIQKSERLSEVNHRNLELSSTLSSLTEELNETKNQKVLLDDQVQSLKSDLTEAKSHLTGLETDLSARDDCLKVSFCCCSGQFESHMTAVPVVTVRQW
jgi:peptidoglycan hydrolase CwlO-like protein